MAEKFTLTENDTLFEFEYDENGFIFLLNHELEGSRVNHNMKKTRIKNVENAKVKAREMLYEMGIVN